MLLINAEQNDEKISDHCQAHKVENNVLFINMQTNTNTICE